MSLAELSYSGGIIRSEAVLPGSKSISNRLVILEAVSGGKVKGLDHSAADDTLNLQQSIRNLSGNVNAGAGGTTFRFLLAYLAAKDGYEGMIGGTPRLNKRPVKPLVDALNALGADITYEEEYGFPPLRVKGRKLSGGSISIDGSISSQFLSALLLVAPTMKNGLELIPQRKIISFPYLKMTAEILNRCGISCTVSHKGVRVNSSSFSEVSIPVERDWSSASYWYNFAALSGKGAEISLPGLRTVSLQGDSLIAAVYEFYGIETKESPAGIIIKNRGIESFHLGFDFTDQPDMAQTIAVTASGSRTHAMLYGLETLRNKETDRIQALRAELAKFGVKTTEPGNGILETEARSAHFTGDIRIGTYEDHRMAMAFSALVLKCGTLGIENPEVVLKSYPGFWKDVEAAGISVTTVE